VGREGFEPSTLGLRGGSGYRSISVELENERFRARFGRSISAELIAPVLPPQC